MSVTLPVIEGMGVVVGIMAAFGMIVLIKYFIGIFF